MRALEQLQTRRHNSQADDCTVIVVVFVLQVQRSWQLLIINHIKSIQMVPENVNRLVSLSAA